MLLHPLDESVCDLWEAELGSEVQSVKNDLKCV